MNFLRNILSKSGLVPNIKKFSTLNKCLEKSALMNSQINSNLSSIVKPNLNKVTSNYALIHLDQTREYKVKTRLRKRCKSCFFVWRNGRLYVECKEHPRHKQHHIDSLLKGYDNIPHGYHVPNV